MPNINEMLLELEGFQFAQSLGLNTGYYHIRLIKNTSNLCTIIIPSVKHCYKLLPTGITNSPDIFQHNMIDIFHGIGFIFALHIWRFDLNKRILGRLCT